MQQLLGAEVLNNVSGQLNLGCALLGLTKLKVLWSEADRDAGASLQLLRARVADLNGDIARLHVAAVNSRLKQVHCWRTDEAGDEAIHRQVVQILWRADLLQLPVAHHGDPRSHRHRLDLVVRHIDDGGLQTRMQAQDLGARLHAQLCVKVGERLVHQEDGRLAHDRAPEGDALALATGELLRLAGEELGEVKDRCRLVDAALDLALLNLAEF